MKFSQNSRRRKHSAEEVIQEWDLASSIVFRAEKTEKTMSGD